MRLYDISAEVRALLEHVAEQEGEIDPVVEQQLDELHGSLAEKVGRYLEIAREYELTARSLKAEEERIRARRQVAENARARLRQRVADALEVTGTRKLDAGTFRVSLRAPTRRVEIDGLRFNTVLHPHLVRTTTTPDKSAIKAALEKGEQIEGASLVETRGGITVR